MNLPLLFWPQKTTKTLPSPSKRLMKEEVEGKVLSLSVDNNQKEAFLSKIRDFPSLYDLKPFPLSNWSWKNIPSSSNMSKHLASIAKSLAHPITFQVVLKGALEEQVRGETRTIKTNQGRAQKLLERIWPKNRENQATGCRRNPHENPQNCPGSRRKYAREEEQKTGSKTVVHAPPRMTCGWRSWR